MKLKLQRNTWIFAGKCFLLGIAFSIFDEKHFGMDYILSGFLQVSYFL